MRKPTFTICLQNDTIQDDKTYNDVVVYVSNNKILEQGEETYPCRTYNDDCYINSVHHNR